MKRLGMMLIVLIIAAGVLFAGDHLSVSVGAAAKLNEPFDLGAGEFVDTESVTLENIGFGADGSLELSVKQEKECLVNQAEATGLAPWSVTTEQV